MPFVEITDAGIAMLGARPARCKPQDYTKRPTKVAVHHDLTIELHGTDFSAHTRLSVGEALGLISMLTYVVREVLEAEHGLK